MTARKPDTTALDDIRRDIDAIDDAILDLLLRRFAATAKVRATKSGDGTLAHSPLRPAREASMLRRLIARGGDQIPPQVLVRLWRVILSSSTLAQAPMTIHMDRGAAEDAAVRLIVAEQFCGVGVQAHCSIGEAISGLASRKGDLAVAPVASDWMPALIAALSSGVRVINFLPMTSSGGVPPLVLLGHADPQPSGQDQTLFVSKGWSATSQPICWQAQSGAWTLTSIEGFHAPDDALVQSLKSSQADCHLVGRVPSPIEITS